MRGEKKLKKIIITKSRNEKLSELLENLQKCGFDVSITSSDGNELLRAIENEKPDILLADAFMENFDIFDFLSEFGKRLKKDGTKIFVKSALENKRFEKRVLLRGADAYLPKPVDYRYITGEKIPAEKGIKEKHFFFRRIAVGV